ncbi:MAG: hypothetical protein M0Z53_05590 [Thermaerobacter sp.]|nr:hypothetical protein [Thermaerobacter sp.]
MNVRTGAPRRVGVAVLIVVGLLAAGCGTQPTAAKQPASQALQSGITIAQATKIVRSYMAQEFKARASWDVAIQNMLEAPPQVYIDDETWIIDKAAGKTPGAPPANLASLPLQVFVPRGANFFAAYINDTYMLFQQEGKGYLQTYSPLSYQGAPVPKVQLDKQGYATFVLPSGYAKLKLTPEQMAAQYAADLETGSQGKAVADSTFSPGPLTSQAFSTLLIHQAGETDTLTAKAMADTPYAFALKGGGALVFCVVAADETHVANPGSHFIIQKGGSDGLAGVMPTGTYTVIASQGEITLAAIVPPAGSSARVQVIGGDYGPIYITGH